MKTFKLTKKNDAYSLVEEIIKEKENVNGIIEVKIKNTDHWDFNACMFLIDFINDTSIDIIFEFEEECILINELLNADIPAKKSILIQF